MRKLYKSDYVVLGLALVGMSLSLINFNLVLGLLFATLAAIYLSVSLAGYLMIALLFLAVNDLFDVLYASLISYYAYNAWIVNYKPLDYVPVGSLNHHLQQYYANVFLIIVGINLALQVMASGSFNSILSPLYLTSMFAVTLKIFSSWMIAKRVAEAAYFFLGYIVFFTFSRFLLVSNFEILQVTDMASSTILIILSSMITIAYIIKNK